MDDPSGIVLCWRAESAVETFSVNLAFDIYLFMSDSIMVLYKYSDTYALYGSVQVRRSSLSQVLNAEAYLLLYIRQSSSLSGSTDNLSLSNSSSGK